MTQSKQREHDVDVWVGKRFPLTIRRLGVNGHGIGYYKHKVCFVPGALPNEVIVAEVTRVLPATSKQKFTGFVKKVVTGLNHAMNTPMLLVALNLKILTINNN